VWRSFSNRNRGGQITPQAIYMIVKRTAARAFCSELDWATDEDEIWERLDGIGAHALRHTGCTIAIGAGAKIDQVQTYARHSDIRTTQRYVHQQETLALRQRDGLRQPVARLHADRASEENRAASLHSFVYVSRSRASIRA
jgi:integrase